MRKFNVLKKFGVIVLLTGVVCLWSGQVSLAGMLEKDELTFGFIKLTDCVPLVIAKEKGFFEEEGLYVTLQAQANWKVLMDRVIGGELDGAHMLAPAPLGAAINLGTKADIVVPYVLSVNGAGITVSNAVWEEMKSHIPQENGQPVHPVKADTLKPVIEQYRNEGKPMNMAMTFPSGTHNIILRYWLAAGGVHPGFYTPTDTSGMTEAEVLLSVTPPPQMAATLESGTISGYCVGEPWNQQSVFKGIGVPVASSYDINRDLPDKVFGVTQQWAEQNPRTLNAVVKGLIRAGQWLDEENGKNRAEAAKILSKPEYVGANVEVIANSMTGTFEYEKGDKRVEPDWNVFFRNHASYPYQSSAVWWLTQLRRWGLIPEAKTDEWYLELSKKVYQPGLWLAAASELVKEGKIPAESIPQTDGFLPTSAHFIDGIEFDGHKPNVYLKKFTIGKKD